MKSECIIQPTTLKCWCFFNILRPRCWLLCSQILGDLVSISWDWFQHLAASEAKLMTDWKRLRWLKAHCAMHFRMMEVLGGKSFTQAGSDENLLSQERRFEVPPPCFAIWMLRTSTAAFVRMEACTQKHCILNFHFDSEPRSLLKSPLILSCSVTSIIFHHIFKRSTACLSCFALVDWKQGKIHPNHNLNS